MILLPSAQPELLTLADDAFARLREASFDGVGITRASYDKSETQAHDIIAAMAVDEGLQAERDAAGNLVLSIEGREPDLPFIICGSHLDSVPQGGNFDGAAGVIAGLAVAASLRRQGARPPRTLKVYAIRGEESAWFGQAYLGSKALFGDLSNSDLALQHRESGASLASYIESSGGDLKAIEAGQVLLDPAAVGCFVELHIEQGPVMVARKVPIGVVTSIRGNTRHASIECVGEAAHSGAVPRWLRHDAVFAVSEFIMRLDRHWQALLEQGHDLVVTVGVIGTNAADHSMSRVPGHVAFALEYRSDSPQLLRDFEELARDEARVIERLRGVKFHFGDPRTTPPATMTPALVRALEKSCQRLGIPHELLPSGAGHDAAVFANRDIPTAMLFIRNEHGSHNANESMEMDDFALGIDVLQDAILNVGEVLS
jgi:N-carbamoyl-L-amino-acid hydrolase